MKFFKLPDLGEGLAEAEIVEWKVSAGDTVEVDQVLLSVETAKALLDAGADVNATFLADGETALMVASRSGSVETVKLLLDSGAKVNAKETLRGTTALIWAAEQGHDKIVSLLLSRGADPAAASTVVIPPQRGFGGDDDADGGEVEFEIIPRLIGENEFIKHVHVRGVDRKRLLPLRCYLPYFFQIAPRYQREVVVFDVLAYVEVNPVTRADVVVAVKAVVPLEVLSNEVAGTRVEAHS